MPYPNPVNVDTPDEMALPVDGRAKSLLEKARQFATRGKVARDISMGGLALVDQMVVSGTSFLTVVLISNLCTRSELGVFSLAWTIVGFLRTAQERMLSAPYLVFAHRDDVDTPSFLGSSLIQQACFSIASSIVVAGCAIVFAFNNRPIGIAPAMVMLIVTIPFLLLRDHVRAICSAHFRYDVSLFINISIAIVQLGAIGLLAYLGKLSIPLIVFVLGAVCVVPLVTWLIRRPQSFHVVRDRVRPDWVTSWDYSRWLVAARLAGMAGFFLVPWIVVYYMDTEAAGAFAACSNLVGLSLMFITGMNNFFQPRSVRAYHDDGAVALARSVLETIGIFLVALGATSVAFFFAGDWLLGLIYGDSYSEFGTVAFLLSLSILTVSISIASGNGLAALGEPKGYFRGELSYCIVCMCMAFWFVPRYGLMGASWALIGGGVAASVVTGLTLIQLLSARNE